MIYIIRTVGIFTSKIVLYFLPLAVLFLLSGCKEDENINNFRPKVMATTPIIADAVNSIGGEFVITETVVGSSGDPHAYRVTEGGVIRLSNADIIFYNGFYLEGRLEYALNKIKRTIPTIALTSGLPMGALINAHDSPAQYNPHFWMDVSLWINAVSFITDNLVYVNPRNEHIYRKNEEQYIINLRDLDTYIKQQVKRIPENNRLLLTNHDAFAYFGNAYGFKTASLKGADTKGELSTADVERIADFIVENNVKTIFGEYNTPLRNIKTLQASLEARGYNVNIGGMLYADTLGASGSSIKNYIDMMTYNIDTITQALKDMK